MVELLEGHDCPGVCDPPESAQTVRTAVAAMERWRHWVRSLPVMAGEEHRTALRGLVAWYERVCADERYASFPPVEGMEALLLVEHERSGATARGLVAARWAVRVADAVAKCRQVSDGDDQARVVALAKLEVALHEALARIEASVKGGN